MSAYTKEPWEAVTPCPGQCCWLLQPVGNEHGVFGCISSPEMSEADAKRVAACVNACAGIPTDALETIGLPMYMHSTLMQQRDELLMAEEGAKAAFAAVVERKRSFEIKCHSFQITIDAQQGVIAGFRRQRDELLAALKEAMAMTDDAWPDLSYSEKARLRPIANRWRAAIAKAEQT